MTAPAAMIEVTDLRKEFGSFVALDDVSLEIREGEFFSLLGPSGCGKTTLLRLIAGFQEPTAGTIAISGESMAGVPPNKRPTNMVFQSYAIFPHLDVRSNVAYGLKRLKLPPEEVASRVARALEIVDLKGLESRQATQLSGGQRQRVALARALILKPKVLLLDEPLSALDKALRELMQVELRTLQRSVGITFVLVTHDQHEALAMSDRIAVMFGGRIAQVATPRELYEAPASRQVAAFIGGMNFLNADLTGTANGTMRFAAEAIGEVEIQSGAGCDPSRFAGKKIVLGVRPERLRIMADKPLEGAAIGGTLTGATYFGESTYYYVTVPGRAQPIIVSAANGNGAQNFSEGAAVHITWDAAALVPLV